MQNYKKLSDLLGSEECKPFVNSLLHKTPAQIALQYRDKIPCDASVLAYIIKLYQKAKSKLPAWVDNFCILTTKSYAQSTSQVVAFYKSTFIKGKKLLVLGGGLGVDEWAFARTFSQIISVDNDADLNKCVAYNNKLLGINNVQRHTQTAEEFLQQLDNGEKFDCIYTDPDRRDETGKRRKTLQHSTPDILALYNKIMDHTERLVIKASPLIDIGKTTNEIKGVSEIRVIAQKNEVKEVLFDIKKGFEGAPDIVAANYTDGDGWQEVSMVTNDRMPSEGQANTVFFYEANAAIIKAGISHQYAADLGLGLIDGNTFYYVSDKQVEGFMGRSFKVKKILSFSKKSIKSYLKGQDISQANIAKRNFRLGVDELRKLFSIKDGGEDYLFFTQKKGKPLLFHCVKVYTR